MESVKPICSVCGSGQVSAIVNYCAKDVPQWVPQAVRVYSQGETAGYNTPPSQPAGAREWLLKQPSNGRMHDHMQLTWIPFDDVPALLTAYAAQQTAALADDIRADGWSVAVHNDYQLNGRQHTFWLFTKGNRCVKGEGETDAEALQLIRAALKAGKDGQQ